MPKAPALTSVPNTWEFLRDPMITPTGFANMTRAGDTPNRSTCRA